MTQTAIPAQLTYTSVIYARPMLTGQFARTSVRFRPTNFAMIPSEALRTSALVHTLASSTVQTWNYAMSCKDNMERTRPTIIEFTLTIFTVGPVVAFGTFTCVLLDALASV